MSCDLDDSENLPQKYDLVPRLSGDTWQGIVFSIVINGAPEDMTGCLVEIAFRKSTLGKVELLLSSDTGDIVIDEHTLTIVPMLLDLAPGTYNYDLQVTYPSEFVRTYLKGTFKVLRDVTPRS